MAPTTGRRDLQPNIDALREAFSCALAAQRRLLAAIAACDRQEVWADDGARDMAHWLSMNLQISHWAARRLVAAAHALESLPKLARALETAALSLDKVVELARFATPETEVRLIRWARHVTVATIRHRADTAARADDDDMAAISSERYLRHWVFDDGKRVGLEGMWPADQGMTIVKALEGLATKVPVDPYLCDNDGRVVPHDEGVAEVRRADALFMMCSGHMATDPNPYRAKLVVHGSVGTLAGGGSGYEIEGGPPLHRAIAEMLLCDCRIQKVLHDEAGEPIGVGRSSRTAPPWMMRHLRHRDRTCRFYGCGVKRFVHAHHLRFWTDEGRTDLDNLLLLCTFHHRLVHVDGWRVERDGDGEVRWYRPGGTHYVPRGSPLSASAA